MRNLSALGADRRLRAFEVVRVLALWAAGIEVVVFSCWLLAWLGLFECLMPCIWAHSTSSAVVGRQLCGVRAPGVQPFFASEQLYVFFSS